jgi:dihydroneopterin aldolase
LVALCFKDPRVCACRVSIVKPDIYDAAAAAGVEIYRVRD